MNQERYITVHPEVDTVMHELDAINEEITRGNDPYRVVPVRLYSSLRHYITTINSNSSDELQLNSPEEQIEHLLTIRPKEADIYCRRRENLSE